MKLFERFKKVEPKDEWEIKIGAPVSGRRISMAALDDSLFASGAMGVCCGIHPQEGAIFSPCKGEVVQLAETKHAFGIRTAEGIEVLVHLGIDTVEMNGEGFTTLIQKGDEVKKGQLVMKMDLDKIRKAKYETTVITIITNTNQFADVHPIGAEQLVVGEDLLSIQK